MQSIQLIDGHEAEAGMIEAALLAAIRDNPDDDLPRLAYADWCEEQGQSDRAELIRVQLQLSRGVRDRGASMELLRRLRTLLSEHREEWLGPLVQYDPSVTFERGFVTRISIEATDFFAGGAEVLAAHPISRLQIHHATQFVDQLAECEQLRGLLCLELRETQLSAGSAGRLAAASWTQPLRSLDVREAALDEQAIVALTAAPAFPRLTSLNLAMNPLSPGQLIDFLGSLGLPRLQRLNLSHTGMGDSCAVILSSCRRLGRLSALRLAFNQFSASSVEILARSENLASLQMLDVSFNPISPPQAEALRREYGPRLLV